MLTRTIRCAALLCAALILPASGGAGEKVQEYWPDGTLKAEYVVDSQGRRAGLSREWHENGAPKSRVIFKLDLMEGPYESWHPNGAVDLACKYRKGALEGAWRQAREDGTLAQSREYRNGLLDGTWQNCDAQGRPIEEAHYRAGLLHGKRLLLQGGELLSEQEYADGLLVGLFGSRWLYAAPLQEVRTTLTDLLTAPELLRLDQVARESGDPLRRLEADRGLAFARLRG